MRSRSNSTESPTRPKLSQQRPKDYHKEEVAYSGRGNVQRRQKEEDDVAQASTILRSPKAEKKQRSSFKKREDLSRDDLLFLLSVLEGELQAQDEVIGVLKAEKIDLSLLEAQYGFVTPKKVLEALQRDAIQTKTEQWQEDVYEKPMGELDKVVEKQKETHRRMLEQLLMVEKSHRQTLYELEEEKRKHSKYMEKSDEFTNLLEQERESQKQYSLLSVEGYITFPTVFQFQSKILNFHSISQESVLLLSKSKATVYAKDILEEYRMHASQTRYMNNT